MPIVEPPHGDPVRSLEDRADALEKRTARPQGQDGHGRAIDQAYKLVAELIGGPLVGLALGYGFQQLTGIKPWGLIGGVLLGFALSIWLAKATADRLTAQAAKENTQGQAPAATRIEGDDGFQG